MADKRISGSGQIRVYIGKCFRLFVTEKQWKNFLSTLIIILIISLVTGKDMFRVYKDTRSGVFAIASACIWAGLFNSIRSVCRERDIIKREHRTGLRISSYILAHVVYEAFLCGGEALIVLLVTLIRNIGHLPPAGVIAVMPFDLFLTFFLIIFSSDMIALLVSCIVRSENTAMTIMPFILVVQLVMSGVIFELKGLADKISYATISRFGVEGVMAVAKTDAYVDFYAKSKENLTAVILKDWGVLLGFCVLYIVLSIIILRFVDRDER